MDSAPLHTFCKNLIKDDLFTHAAALAFYLALALAPLFILIIVSFGLMNMDLSQQLVEKINSLMGGEAASLFSTLSSGARQRDDLRTSSSLIAILALVLSASAIFGQMETAFYAVLGYNTPDSQSSPLASIISYLKMRAFGGLLVLIFIVILIVSLSAASAVQFISGQHTQLYTLLNFAGDLFAFTMIFSLVFKILPQRSPSYRDSFIAGTITSLLFIFGKHLVGIYMGIVASSSTYGVAGLPIALFIWLFYSSFAVVFGAEILKIIPHLRNFERETRPRAFAKN